MIIFLITFFFLFDFFILSYLKAVLYYTIRNINEHLHYRNLSFIPLPDKASSGYSFFTLGRLSTKSPSKCDFNSITYFFSILNRN